MVLQKAVGEYNTSDVLMICPHIREMDGKGAQVLFYTYRFICHNVHQ